MPRDNDDNNRRPPGRRGPPPGGKGGGARSGKFVGKPSGKPPARGGRPDRPSRARPEGKDGGKRFGEKKFGARASSERPPSRDRSTGEGRGERKSFGSKASGGKSFEKKPFGEKPWQKREGGPARSASGDRGPRKFEGKFDRPRTDRPDRPKFDRPKFDRPKFDRPREDHGGSRDDRPRTPRPEGRSYEKRDSKPYGERKFGQDRSDEKPWQKREDRPARSDGDRGEKKFDRPKFDRPRDDRGGRGDRPRAPRAEGDRFKKPFEKRSSSDKPWQKREGRPAREPDGDRAPSRFERKSERKFDRPREDRPRSPRGAEGDRGPRKFDRPREDRPARDRDERPRAPRSDWQEHPRSENTERREGEHRPAVNPAPFGGRGEYRERKPDFNRGRDSRGDRKGHERRPSFRDREAPAEAKPKKPGERIAKVVARAGLCSRRDAEQWIIDGRVTVNGRVITSPALDVTSRDVIAIDGKALPERERTRLFLYHKPRGLVTTHSDPEGRPTVFDNLPEGLPRLISIGRLDFNTEGLLLLTNDGGLARTLELPDTGWLRRYRVRAHGEITQPQLDALRDGIEVEGVKYGEIEAKLDREQGANSWLTFAIREGKNREVRNVLGALGMEVNRLIRISYGPFQLNELAEGDVEEVKTRVLREQLGDRIAEQSGADFALPARDGDDDEKPARRGRDDGERTHRAGLIKDRKGRRVLVERAITDAPRNKEESEDGFEPPRKRPTRPYRGKGTQKGED